ncbi:nucleoporin p54-like isoform X8 [Eriocheir sinensis]|uniref:nucleoporin p54-like isoform X6 n=1 Tax=Eriocheir sinensis TaxID=95602 RepID=UPI0021C7C372|nr:nucleoporin p54-like isoform X6 [Eriocheir sinensis]XP_050723629.1 nucleoporin p54-like isoform X7 [Eriocheir sinensis]XP_050723637.1 nucleoporin p54-like isoform X8 [Eriocheir sinensis]
MATPNFSFGGGSTTGTAQTAPAFGTSSASGGGVTGGFAFGATSTAQPSTGTFGFGTTNTAGATQQGSFGFGSSTATPSTGFGFGTTATTATATPGFGTSPFSTNTPASTGTGFQPASQQAKPFSFGTSNNLLGSTFGAKLPTFGAQTLDATQQQQLQLQQQGMMGQPDPFLALHLAICTPSYFNNENDEVLRKWNQLQAFGGAGKGYYAPNMPPVEFTPENPYCRFKVVCYARIPSYHNEDGIVQIVLAKPLSEIEPHKQQIVTTLNSIFGGAEVVVSEMFAAELPDRTNVRLYVQQTLSNGEKERATAMDVSRHMSQPAYSQTLKNLCIQEVLPLVNLSEAQLKEYLDTPQRGIDPALWEQGKRENPDPQKFFPVVKVGFQELQKQFKHQEEHAEKLQANMNNIMEEITQLRHKQTMMKAAIQDAKWKQANLTRRVLKLVSAQEVERKRGVPLDQTEEQIRMRLEDLYMQLMQPTQYRGCLNELMAQMCVKPASSQGGPRYGLVGDMERVVSQYMAWQHDALQAVVGVLKEDLVVVDSMVEEIQRKS